MWRMNAEELKKELQQGFQSALQTLVNSPDINLPLQITHVEKLLAACANNAATGLAERTISNEVADRLAEAGYTLDDAVSRGMFLLAEEMQKKAGG